MCYYVARNIFFGFIHKFSQITKKREENEREEMSHFPSLWEKSLFSTKDRELLRY